MEQLTLSDISKRLTYDVLGKSFKVKTKSNDSIQSVTVTRAAPAGEGLVSAVYRIHVAGTTHEASFVAKGLVRDILLRRTLRCTVLFEREILFFSQILPVFKELQKSLGAKEDIQENVPICYAYYMGDQHDYILLEDLLDTSCKSVGKPGKRERDATLKVLAHLHAVSMALRVERPNIFSILAKELTEVYYNDINREWYAKYLENAIEIDKEALREYEPENSIYYKKFLKLVKHDVYEQMICLTRSNSEHLALCHGDAWFPNFMYSKDRAVTIDFQLFRCASPVTDLSYYISLCSNLCLNKNDYDEAVTVYYSFLVHFLTDLNLNAIEIFSKDDLYNEIEKYGKFGLLAALTSIPLLASERCDVGSTFADKFVGVERIPLENIWTLAPLKEHEQKMKLLNAVRAAVDMGLI